jgi:hypothetical protein
MENYLFKEQREVLQKDNIYVGATGFGKGMLSTCKEDGRSLDDWLHDLLLIIPASCQDAFRRDRDSLLQLGCKLDYPHRGSFHAAVSELDHGHVASELQRQLFLVEGLGKQRVHSLAYHPFRWLSVIPSFIVDLNSEKIRTTGSYKSLLRVSVRILDSDSPNTSTFPTCPTGFTHNSLRALRLWLYENIDDINTKSEDILSRRAELEKKSSLVYREAKAGPQGQFKGSKTRF